MLKSSLLKKKLTRVLCKWMLPGIKWRGTAFRSHWLMAVELHFGSTGWLIKMPELITCWTLHPQHLFKLAMQSSETLFCMSTYKCVRRYITSQTCSRGFASTKV